MSRGSDRWAVGVMTGALVAVGGLAWWLYLAAVLRVDASEFSAFPHDLGAWNSQDIPIDAMVESMLRADFQLQRAYVHPLGEVVWLYVGYYGTARGGTPEHLPSTCYRAHGWRIEAERRVQVDPRLGLQANEYVIERDGHHRLVHFWYRSHRDTGILSLFGLSVDHLFGRLFGQRADGALVRLSTPIGDGDDIVTARSRLVGFGAVIDPLLAERWPTEKPLRADG